MTWNHGLLQQRLIERTVRQAMTAISSEARDHRVPCALLVPGDKVRATLGGPVGTVKYHRNDWCVVGYNRHLPQPTLVPYQHGLDTPILVASPSRHDLRHAGPAEGCTECWAAIVNDPVRATVQTKMLDRVTNLAPGDDLTVHLEVRIVNDTGERQVVKGIEYGPVRFLT